MPKETLKISHGELSIPPWPVPLFGRVDIPVPDGFTDAAPLPDAAFAADSGKLICLVEFDWEAILSDSASEDVTRFPHPGKKIIEVRPQQLLRRLVFLPQPPGVLQRRDRGTFQE